MFHPFHHALDFLAFDRAPDLPNSYDWALRNCLFHNHQTTQALQLFLCVPSPSFWVMKAGWPRGHHTPCTPLQSWLFALHTRSLRVGRFVAVLVPKCYPLRFRLFSQTALFPVAVVIQPTVTSSHPLETWAPGLSSSFTSPSLLYTWLTSVSAWTAAPTPRPHPFLSFPSQLRSSKVSLLHVSIFLTPLLPLQSLRVGCWRCPPPEELALRSPITSLWSCPRKVFPALSYLPSQQGLPLDHSLLLKTLLPWL